MKLFQTDREQLHCRLKFCLKKINEANKTAFGIVSISDQVYELYCVICLETFNSFEEFVMHIQANHIKSEYNPKLLDAYDEDDLIAYSNDEKHEVNEDIDQIVSFDDNIAEKEVFTNNEFEETDPFGGCEESKDFEAETQGFVMDSNEEYETINLENKDFIEGKTSKIETFEIESNAETNSDSEINECVSNMRSLPKDRILKVQFLIDMYKQNAILWDYRKPEYKQAFVKADIFCDIAKKMNEKFQTNTTGKNVRKKILYLRSRYKKELETMIETKRTKPNLWYFDKLSFINIPKDNKEESTSIPSNKETETTYDYENNFDLDYNHIVLGDKEIDHLIDLYKQHPILWSHQIQNKSKHEKEQAYIEIRDCLQKKFPQNITTENIKNEIAALRAKFRREIRNKNVRKRKKSKLWFFDKLSFIEEDIKETKMPGQSSRSICFNISPHRQQSGEEYLARDQTECTEYLIEILEQFPVLWNRRIAAFQSKYAKREAYAKIIDMLKEKFSKNISQQSLRRKILDLRVRLKNELESMAENNRTDSHLWYFDKMAYVFRKPDSVITSGQPPNSPTPNPIAVKQFEDDIDFNLDFIELYKSCECLWNKRNSDYTNQERRSEALDFIIKILKNDWKIDVTENAILEKIAIINFLCKRKKLKNLLFNVEENSTNEKWYFNKLNFLEEGNVKENDISLINRNKCEICSDRFNDDIQLKNHYYQKHNIKAHICEICNKSFHLWRSLKRHSYTHLDVDGRRHDCKICGAKFSEQSNLILHIRRHAKTHTYACDVCKHCFVTKTELSQHRRKHTGEKPYVCDICGKSYRFKEIFRTHRDKHLNEPNFKCSICEKYFYSRKNLTKHLTTHSNERKHICDICGKGFKLRNTLRQHKQLHSADKKYSCKICGQQYAQAAGLHCHMKSHAIAQVETPSNFP